MEFAKARQAKIRIAFDIWRVRQMNNGWTIATAARQGHDTESVDREEKTDRQSQAQFGSWLEMRKRESAHRSMGHRRVASYQLCRQPNGGTYLRLHAETGAYSRNPYPFSLYFDP